MRGVVVMPTQGVPAPAILTGMRRFVLQRNHDVSGMSGTGVVAEGVEFSNGMCALTWLTPYSSVGVYASLKTLDTIHSHGGATIVVMLDDKPT